MKKMVALLAACIVRLFFPAVTDTGTTGLEALGQTLVKAVVPAFSYAQQVIAEEAQLRAEAEYENRMAADTARTAGTSDSADSAGTEESTVAADTAQTQLSADTAVTVETGDVAQPAETADTSGTADTEAVIEPYGTNPADGTAQSLLEKMKDFDYLVQNFYIVDSSTTVQSTDLSAEELLAENLTVDTTADGPQILIYHTHSQEGYADSGDGDAETSVAALGEMLADILTEQYGFSVLHHTGEYDVDDRDHAYSNAAPVISQLLLDNPTIEVVIDLHRDSVQEDTRLVTTINGKPTAKIMFFNGLCRTTAGGDLTYLQNPYLQDNLAFSLQMQVAAAQKYPDFTRKIYLKGYRYNMHFCPKSLLVEVGAQNNTFEEAANAMEPLAELLAEVLGEK